MPFYDVTGPAGAFAIGFARNPRIHFNMYASGYFKIADEQAIFLLTQEEGFRDYEVYPIIFLYRHCLELYLKSCIYNTSLLSYILENKELDHSLINNHRLVPLAFKAKLIIGFLFPNDKRLGDFCDLFYDTATEFQKIDPDSYAFRYPLDSKGYPCFESNHAFNLCGFQKRFLELHSEFEALHFGIEIATEQWVSIYESLL